VSIQVLIETQKNSPIEEVAVEMHDPNITGFAESEHRRGGRRGPRRKRGL